MSMRPLLCDFRRFPRIPRDLILQHLTIFDLLLLSFCSKRCREIVADLIVRAELIEWRLDSTPFCTMSILFNSSTQIRWLLEITPYCKDQGSFKFQAHGITMFLKQQNNNRPDLHWYRLSVSCENQWENWTSNFAFLFEHLSKVFCAKEQAISSSRTHATMISTVLKLRRFKRIQLHSGESMMKGVWWCPYVKTHWSFPTPKVTEPELASLMREVLEVSTLEGDEFLFSLGLELDLPSIPNFTYTQRLNHPDLFVKNGEWLTVQSLLKTENLRVVRALNTCIQEDELMLLVEKWMRKEFPKLRSIDIVVEEAGEFGTLLKSCKKLEGAEPVGFSSDCNGHYECPKYMNKENSVLITRDDGGKVVVIMEERKFSFRVIDLF